LAERKRRGDDAVDDRLDEADSDDVSVDDDLADDELNSDLDDLADDEDEPAGRGSATVRKRTRLTKASAEDDDADDVDEDDDEEDDAKGRAKADGRRGPKGRSSKPGDKRPVKKGGDRPNVLARLGNFVREVVAELRKVIWPTRKELLTYTAVVVVFVTIMFTLVAGLDWVFTKGVVTVFGHGTSK